MFTPKTGTAGYRPPKIRWAFRPDADREPLLLDIPSSTPAWRPLMPALSCSSQVVDSYSLRPARPRMV
jgi:hypothetical protein